MWTVGVTRIARHSKFGVDSSSFTTLCFYVQRFKLFWVCLRSVCFSFFLATPYTAFQMTVGSLPWATPRTRFLIAQCFRLPLLPRFASMMTRTFNDVYCTSPGEPGLGRKTTPTQWIFFTSVFQKSTIAFLFMILDQFVLVQCLAIAYTAFQMTLGSWTWATPRTRFLIAQCFRLPLLYRFASMMARTFNDVYCISPK